MNRDRSSEHPGQKQGQDGDNSQQHSESTGTSAAAAGARSGGDAEPADGAGGPGEAPFDAIAAAAELDAALAAEEPGVAATGRGEDYTGMLEAEVEELNALLADKDQRIQALEDEIDRARSRIEREAAREVEQRTRKVVLGFLAVLDDLERALAAARQVEHDAAMLEGMDLVRKRFLAALGELGVRHVASLSTPFDPAHHEAVSVVPVTDPAQDGVVIGVIREGYMIGEEVLRPAGVAVGRLSG